MKYEENMSGWRKALEDKKIENISAEDDRLASLKRLAKSRFPTYEYYFMDLSEFYVDTSKAREIADKYSGSIVVRAISNNGSQRFTSINKSIEYTITDFKTKIPEDNIPEYKIVINEYDPAEYCGVVISTPERLMIEMVKEPNLENICHGHVIPWSAEFKQKFPHEFKRMHYYNTVDEEVRKKMWCVIKELSKFVSEEGVIPHYEPMLGYFEFVFSQKTGKLLFIDYK